ncbi:MAG: hypothetical protein O2894_12030 [Planctomycetota bacterium]|nr:hypothetical protein [Planctomycetota bacterium]
MRLPRASACVLLACVLAVGAGCVEVESETRLGANGAGHFVETVTVDLEKLAAVRRQLRAKTATLGEDEDALLLDPFGVLDPKRRLSELEATPGFTRVARRTREAPQGKARYEFSGQFDSLDALFRGGFVDDMEASLHRVRQGTAWRLHARSLYDDDELDLPAQRAVLGVRRLLVQPFRSAAEGLVVERRIVFPTRVLETNGVLAADGRTVTWRVNLDGLIDPTALRQTVVFAHDESLSLTPFGERPAIERGIDPKDADPEAKDEGAPAKGPNAPVAPPNK